MANDFYTNVDTAQRFQPGSTIEAGAVDGKLDEVEAGFNGVQVETDRALKLATETGASQSLSETALQRRGRVVGFDDAGKLSLRTPGNWRNDWATGTTYYVNDVFRDPATGDVYWVEVKHASDTIANDAAAGRIDKTIDVAEIKQIRLDTQAIKNQAETARDLSLQYRDASGVARDASQLAQTGSETARDKSQAWAEKPEDVAVEVGAYSALHHRAKAEAAQGLSLQYRNASQDAQGLSEQARNASQSARDLSLQYRNESQTARNASQTAQGLSEQAQGLSEQAQTSSETARDKSQAWAATATDTEVEIGQYSALHHADKASEHASAAGLARTGTETARDTTLGYRNEAETFKDQAEAAVVALPEGTINDLLIAPDKAWSSQKITDELQLQATRALTQSLTVPPTVRDVGAWSIDASATSRHTSGNIMSFEVTWWDGTTETVTASGAAATLARAVDQPVGGTVSATVRALDDIGNASRTKTVTADVVANDAPVGPITISAPTQTDSNSTFQVSFSGATDAEPITYTVTDSGSFTFSKTSGIAEGEIVEVTAPDVADDTDVAFSVAAEDDVGARSATYSETVTVLASQVIGVALRATGGPGGTWDHIDQSGVTIATPTASWFNGHPVFGGIADVIVDGQDMVEIPKFYYKRGTAGGDAAWWISDQPIAGFTVMPAFVLNGAEIAAFQYGKYQASESGGKLQSVAGVLPLVSTSLTDFLTKATARNVSGVAGFRLHHYDMWLAIQWLYLVENATMDSQTKTGQGRVNASSAANVDAADVAQATYRGIVGLWGNVYQWMDGARTLNSVIERRAYDAAGWVSTGESVPTGGGTTYPVTFRTSAPLEFIPDTYSAANDSTATLPDYVRWRDSGEYYTSVGGDWGGGAGAGLWVVYCAYSASSAFSSLGGRLSRIVA